MLKPSSLQRVIFYASVSRLRHRGLPSAFWLAGRCLSTNCRPSFVAAARPTPVIKTQQ